MDNLITERQLGSDLLTLVANPNIVRFWGWEENARELAKNRVEMDARAAAGLEPYGKPTMDEAAQGVAARNSKYAALKFCKYPAESYCN